MKDMIKLWSEKLEDIYDDFCDKYEAFSDKIYEKIHKRPVNRIVNVCRFERITYEKYPNDKE